MDAIVARKTILIVDDDTKNRGYLETVLKAEGYAILEASSGELAMELLLRHKPDLVLLDAMMPGLDGFQVASRLKANPETKPIPIIMVTSLDDRGSRMKALQSGVEEFLTKPVDRSELWVRVRNLLRLKEYGDFLSEYSRTLEHEVEHRTQQLLESHFDTIFTIVRAAEFRDEETGAHVKRIAVYCRELSQFLGMDSDFAHTIYHASPLHDVGKIGIPDHILLKPGKHTAEEWEIMKTHAVLGARILGAGKSQSPFTKMGAEIALNHHERWDGSGYPNGLHGEAIPLAARIMGICDVYDALRSTRPYKPSFAHPRAVSIITEGDGRTLPEHFDPDVLNAFVTISDKFAEIYDALSD